jgi:hypothetical protein
MPIHIIISDCQITASGTLEIQKLSLIDSETGESLRIAKITPELVTLLKSIEIDVELYSKIKDNKKLMYLIKTFNLITL